MKASNPRRRAPGAGGARPGAGRPKVPRMSPEDTRALLLALFPRLYPAGLTAGPHGAPHWSGLAARMGVGKRTISDALKEGIAVSIGTRWKSLGEAKESSGQIRGGRAY
jgi:hypothetical protein